MLNDSQVSEIVRLLRDPPERFETRRVSKSLLNEDEHFAIRESDLSMLREAAAVVGGAGAIPTKGLSIVVGLMTFWIRYRRESVVLDGLQAVVLFTLRGASPQGRSLQEIREDLTQVGVDLGSPELLHILKGLAEARASNGKAKPLAEELPDARWLAPDVF